MESSAGGRRRSESAGADGQRRGGLMESSGGMGQRPIFSPTGGSTS